MKEFDAQRQDESIQFALSAAGIGTWDVYLLEDKVAIDDQCRLLLGFAPGEPRDKLALIRQIHPLDQILLIEAFNKALLVKADYAIDLKFRTADEQRWLQVKGRSFPDKAGKAFRFSGILSDITLEVQANEKIHAAESLAALALEGADTGSFSIDLHTGGFKHSPSLAYLLTGEANLAVTRDVFIEHVYHEDASAREKAYAQAEETGYVTYEARFRWNDGSLHWIKVKGKYLSDLSGRQVAFSGIAQDISLEMAVREELVRNRNRVLEAQRILESAVDIANLATWEIRPKEGLFQISGRMKLWTGYEPEEPVTMEQVLATIPDRLKVEAALAKAMQPDGSGLLDVDYHLINSKTSKLYVMHSKGQAFFTSEGEPYLVIGTTQDITMQRQIEIALESEVAERTEELAASNEELTASNEELAALNEEFSTMNEELQLANENLLRSNQELEQYAYVASHDLQEPLRKIRIYSDMLSHQQELSDQQQKLVNKIDLSAQRMSMLIKDLLEFSRLLETGGMIERVDLNVVLQNVVNDFELVIEDKKAKVILGELPVIEGIRLQMNQLFYNLLGNALKFVRPEAPPLVEVFARMITASEVDIPATAAGKSRFYYEISVKDNGIGFEQKYASQVFQVFKRLHASAVYQGSGIGLAMCKRIVMNHGGDLNVFSAPGNGSTFRILLPVLGK